MPKVTVTSGSAVLIASGKLTAAHTGNGLKVAFWTLPSAGDIFIGRDNTVSNSGAGIGARFPAGSTGRDLLAPGEELWAIAATTTTDVQLLTGA